MQYTYKSAAIVNIDGLAKTVILFLLQQMTAEYGYVWFFPAWFTERWWDTDKHNAAFPNEKVPCTSAEMLSAIQGHFILTTAFLGEENSQIVGNCTVRNWLEAYLEHLQALVGVSRHSVYSNYPRRL